MRVTEKQVREKVKALGEIIEQYNLMRKEEGKKRDWRTYEERLARRIRDGMRQLEPLIDEAVNPSCRAGARKETITHPEAEGDYPPHQTVI